MVIIDYTYIISIILIQYPILFTTIFSLYCNMGDIVNGNRSVLKVSFWDQIKSVSM